MILVFSEGKIKLLNFHASVWQSADDKVQKNGTGRDG